MSDVMKLFQRRRTDEKLTFFRGKYIVPNSVSCRLSQKKNRNAYIFEQFHCCSLQRFCLSSHNFVQFMTKVHVSSHAAGLWAAAVRRPRKLQKLTGDEFERYVGWKRRGDEQAGV